MPKSYRGEDIIKALTKKGFDMKKSHHIILILKINGKKTKIHTKISHSDRSKKLPTWKLVEIARQLGFRNSNNKIDWNNFYDLIDCPMDYQAYVNYLKQRGVI